MLIGWMNHLNKQNDEDTIMVTLVVTHALNYNSYLNTLIFIPVTILTSCYFQMVAQAEIVAKIDVPEWGGGTLETEADKISYVTNKIFTMIVLVFVTVAHQYNIHKDLSVSVIEKCMLARQQAQLSNFFESSEDCVIVASQNEEDDKFTVELCNKRAEEVLDVSLFESQLLTKYSMTGFDTPIIRLK